MATLDDPVLRKLRAALDDAYGDRLERVVLFGSRARGEATPESDYDIAVFLKAPHAFGVEVARIAEIGTELLYETGAVINALPLPAEAYRDRTGLMRAIRREGVEL